MENEIDDAEAPPETGDAPDSPPAIRVRGRSFMALALTPSAPLDAWIEALDAAIARAAAFFVARPVVLDLGLLASGATGLSDLPASLHARGIRVIATENAAAADGLAGFPEPLSGGRSTGDETIPDESDAAAAPEAAPPLRSLVITEPVRSGSQVIFAEGDVTVLGSVASGAEVLAGGTIHVYGALRGRAIAGFGGRPDARVICRRLEAELIAIDGFYLTADDMDGSVVGGPAQAFLDGEAITLRALD